MSMSGLRWGFDEGGLSKFKAVWFHRLGGSKPEEPSRKQNREGVCLILPIILCCLRSAGMRTAWFFASDDWLPARRGLFIETSYWWFGCVRCDGSIATTTEDFQAWKKFNSVASEKTRFDLSRFLAFSPTHGSFWRHFNALLSGLPSKRRD